MKQLFIVLSIAFGLLLFAPVVSVQADSDSGSAASDADSGSAVAVSSGGGRSVPELDRTVAGSAMVLLLGGVAYLASRRRRDDSA
jgi:hypothetical protein